MTELKKCSKCGELKEATTEHFYKKKNVKSGLTAMCKECILLTRRKGNNNSIDRRVDKYGNKACTVCGEIKPYTQEFFYKKKGNKYGLASDCKECSRKRRKENRNSELDKQRNKRWRENNSDYIKQKTKEYYERTKGRQIQYKKDNREKVNSTRKKWYQKTAGIRREKARENYQKNKMKISSKSRESYKKHREKRIAQKKTKRQQDTNTRIKCNLRRRLNNAIKTNSKTSSTLNLLGCSIDYLKHHLEKQFSPEMSWDNYGRYGWHIDHIIPCASFDLSKEEEQKKCFHYTNLQPLWWKDNLQKGSKIL